MLFFLFNVIAVCLTFIFVNWKFWLFIAFAYIFVKCLLTNFYEKHFKFKGKLWDKNLIKIIWQNKEILATFFLKLLLYMIPIRILIKMCAFWLFNNENNTICSSILIILLCLPFIYYFLNIITKYLKKNKREAKDSFLFNDYVIKNINLYNIMYIISTILLINLYFIYCLSAILIILIVLIISSLWCSSFNYRFGPPPPKGSNGTNPLEAAAFPPISTGWLSIIGSLGLHLSIGATAECGEVDSAWIRDKSWNYFTFIKNTVEANNLNTNDGNQALTTTTNWLHKDVSSLSKNDDIESNMNKTISILKSPILRMVYGQKNYIESDIVRRDLGKMVYEPQTLFINDKFIGSVGVVKNTLVVNFLKVEDSTVKDKTFLPTHYIHDDSLRQLHGEMEPLVRTIKFLEEKFGIFIPNKERVVNIITLTEIELFDNQTLRKVFRPCLNYTDLDSRFRRVEKYYQCKKKDTWNLNFDDQNLFNKVKEIKTNVKSSTIANDIKLNELYVEYFKTRLNCFKEICPDIKVEPDFSAISIQGEFLYKCTAVNPLTPVVLFREDDLLIYRYRDYEFIDMITTRDRLLERIKGEDISRKCYVVCANQISMEFLCIENPNVDLHINDLPLIYSVVDMTNLKYNKVYHREEIRSIYNILNRRDGYSLQAFLISV